MEKAKIKLELITRYFADFTSRQLEQLSALDDLYRDWNDKINVISRKDIGSLYEKHVLHSLSVAAAFEFQPGMDVIDIGTGGGFPGIPLAIFYPETRFHLVDSIGKKIKVVEAVRDAIGLINLSTQHGRAEEIRNRKFDVAVSRAVAPLKDLWAWSKPLLRKPSRAQQTQFAQRHDTGAANPGGGREASPGTDPKASPGADSEMDFLVNGLICLKGGDLASEISESGCRPRILEVYEIFQEEYFREKYLLYNPL